MQECYGLNRLSVSGACPVSVEALRRWARIDYPGDDEILTAEILAACEAIEAITGIATRPGQYLLTLDEWPDDGEICLPRWPVSSVDSLKYLDYAGTLQTLTPSAYVVDLLGNPVTVTPTQETYWPAPIRSDRQAVQVTFTAGYASADLVHPLVVKAIKLAATNALENRGDDDERGAAEGLPRAALALLRMVWNGVYGL